MTWANTSVRSKLILSILLVSGLSLVIGLTINTLQDIQTYKDDLNYQATILALMVGDYAQAALDFELAQDAREILAKLKNHDYVLGARFLSTEGNVFATYGQAEILAGLEPGEFSRFEDQLFFISRPVILQGNSYGTIQIGFSTTMVRTKVYTQIFNMLLILLVTLFFTFLVSIKVEEAIQSPILDLVKMSDQISREEDYTLRVKKRTDDEIGSLYDSFNNMLNVIQNRERHLKIREENFRNIFNTQNDAIFIHNTKGQIMDVNDTMLEMYQVSREQALKLNIVDDLTAPDMDTEPIDQIWEVTMEGVPHEFEWKARRPFDDKVFDVQVNLQKVKHHGEDAILATVRDITDRKAMERELKASETKFRNLIEHLHDAVFVVEGEHLLIQNNKCRELFGLSPELEPGRPFRLEKYLSEDSVLRYRQTLQDLNLSTVKETQCELTVLPGIGRNRQIDASFSYIRMGSGIALQGILRDITEKKSLEEQFRQSQKMEAVGRLAGGVAHDFNNILTVINGYCDLLINHQDLVDTVRKPLLQIQQSGQRAARLTRQLLAFSRKQVIQPKTIDVNKEITELYSMLVRLIGEHIQFKTQFEPGLPRIKIDLGQLEQVILNITVNARDAMPDGGTLTIETRKIQITETHSEKMFQIEPGTYAMIAISDTGIGMDEKTTSRIFEPFFSTKDLGKGTGLGLSMVYGILQQNCGRISVYSELGVGTTFKCYFPAASGDHDPRRPSESTEQELDGNERILAVEDNDELRDLLRELFKDLNYRVYFAKHGENALELVEEMGAIDLLLTDVVMPAKSGPQLAQELVERFPDMKILFMSGYTGNELIQDQLLQESVDFIQKPFTSVDLLSRVRYLLDLA